jgi:hypothetical protein
MPRYERPLTDDERAELQRIRHNRQVRNARREIQNANYFNGTGKGLLLIVVLFFGLGWPLEFLHKPGTDDPSAVGWTVFVIWMLVVVLPIAILWDRANKKKKAAPKARVAGESGELRNEIFERQAQELARKGTALSNISDPALRDRVADLRYH